MKKFRYTLARVRGRGAGLGNELIPWARAFLAAQVIDAICLPPAFGLNTRRYGRHFGTPRWDWLRNRSLERILPVVEFDQVAYERHGAGDVVTALRGFAEAEQLAQRGPFVLVTEGMWGGYRHIRAATDFVRSTLYGSRFAAPNLLRISARLATDKLIVGMHVRMGDFGAPTENLEAYRGQFNLALPLAWYRNVARSIRRTLGEHVQFLVISDGNAAAVQAIFEDIAIITTSDIADADCSDLLALANADLLVCSVSSFSTTAAFLSHAPYLWFEPNLQRHDGRAYSIWGHESAQMRDDSATRTGLNRLASAPSPSALARGTPIGFDGAVPPALLHSLLQNKDASRVERDLIYYGVVPIQSCGAADVDSVTTIDGASAVSAKREFNASTLS